MERKTSALRTGIRLTQDSTFAAMLRWVRTIPFGCPVVPDV